MFKQRITAGGLGAMLAALLLGGCATQGQQANNPDEAAVSGGTQETTEPAPAPDAASNGNQALMPEKNKSANKELALLQQILDKMARHRLTLYWSATNSYSFSVGDVVEAEFVPGQGLSVRDLSQGNIPDALTCSYDLNGNLQQGEAQATPCAKLLRTLDAQLGE